MKRRTIAIIAALAVLSPVLVHVEKTVWVMFRFSELKYMAWARSKSRTVRDIFGDSRIEVDEGVDMDEPLIVLVEWLDAKGIGRSVNVNITMDFLTGRTDLPTASQIIAEVLRPVTV